MPQYQSKSIKTLELQSQRYKIKPASSLSLRCFIITRCTSTVIGMGICQRGNDDVDGYVSGYVDGDADGDVGGDDASVGYMSPGVM